MKTLQQEIKTLVTAAGTSIQRINDMELKPCPFCGGEALAELLGTGRQLTIIQCQECGCTLESNESFNHGSCWNTRTQDPLIEELAEKIADRYCKDELLKEMADVIEWISEDGHAMASMTIGSRKRLVDVLKKYHDQCGENND